jgi:hypothetical protein
VYVIGAIAKRQDSGGQMADPDMTIEKRVAIERSAGSLEQALDPAP